MEVTDGHLATPGGLRVRRPSQKDAAAVAEIKRSVEVALHGDSDVTEDTVREEWALPRLDLDHDVWLVEDEGGVPLAYGLCWVEAPPGEIVAEQTVRPEARGHGLSELLLDLGEARAAEQLRAASPNSGGCLGVWSHVSDASRLALYERRGYEQVRVFLRLDRDLEPAVEDRVWPAGITVATFRKRRDDDAVHAAGEEAFRDHFRPAEMDLEEWREFRFSRDDLDTGLWLVAWHGDEVAGAILAFETPSGGYLDELFVRRPWRGRGLGRALLLEECAELRRRGQRLAYLGVDSENPTGAMRLYESAGFRSLRGPTLFLEKKLAAG
jgi:mycothiol synthase